MSLHPLWTRWLRWTTLSPTQILSLSWRGISSADIPQTTLMCIFVNFLRSVTPSSSRGHPPTIFDWGSSLSNWRIEPVAGCRMRSLTHSSHKKLSPKPSSTILPTSQNFQDKDRHHLICSVIWGVLTWDIGEIQIPSAAMPPSCCSWLALSLNIL